MVACTCLLVCGCHSALGVTTVLKLPSSVYSRYEVLGRPSSYLRCVCMYVWHHSTLLWHVGLKVKGSSYRPRIPLLVDRRSIELSARPSNATRVSLSGLAVPGYCSTRNLFADGPYHNLMRPDSNQRVGTNESGHPNEIIPVLPLAAPLLACSGEHSGGWARGKRERGEELFKATSDARRNERSRQGRHGRLSLTIPSQALPLHACIAYPASSANGRRRWRPQLPAIW